MFMHNVANGVLFSKRTAQIFDQNRHVEMIQIL